MMITQLAEWKELERETKEAKKMSLRQEFAQDPNRWQTLSVSLEGEVIFDFSRQLVTEKTMKLLYALAEARNLRENIRQMFQGRKINLTENRAALHVALRNLWGGPIDVDGQDVMPQVRAALAKIRDFSRQVILEKWRGITNRPVKNIVAIGIGGSYLGPEFVAEANRAYSRPGMRLFFVANVDGTDFAQTVVQQLDPEETLFVIISKTFTTVETMMNARKAREWMVSRLKGHPEAEIVKKHFVAVSTNIPAVEEFGIDPVNTFEFWDWVGGRFSVSSAVGGVPLSLYLGYENFEDLLAGGYAMDRHFLEAPFNKNMPVIMGLLSIWNNDLLGYNSRAILPYSQALRRFPAHIQQVVMESNGKRVDIEGRIVPVPTGPVIFGEPGTNGQHSFYQLLHQGQVVPCDFIGFIRSQYHGQEGERSGTSVDSHQELMANFFAQPDALAFGKTEEELRQEGVPEPLIAHKTFPGNRPSSLILFNRLVPKTTGMLLALYEHQTAVEGFIWGIDSFDQWGVELGKVLGKRIRGRIMEYNQDREKKVTEFNPATNAMLQIFLDGNRD
ncbi:MAG: glucose-6-phosphate isomerase [bacterium]